APIAAALTHALAPRPEARVSPARVIDVLGAVSRGENVPVLPLPQPTPPPPPAPARPSLPPTTAMPPGPPMYPPTAPAHDLRRQNVVEAWPDLPAQAPAVAVGPPRPRSLATFGLWLATVAVGLVWPGVAIIAFVVAVVATATLGS